MILEGTTETLTERLARVRLEAIKANEQDKNEFFERKAQRVKERFEREARREARYKAINYYDNNWGYGDSDRGYVAPEDKKWQGRMDEDIKREMTYGTRRLNEFSEESKKLRGTKMPQLPRISPRKATVIAAPRNFAEEVFLRVIRMKLRTPVAIGMQVLLTVSICLTMLLIIGANVVAAIVVPSVIAAYWNLSKGALEYRRQKAVKPVNKVAAVEKHYEFARENELTSTKLRHQLEHQKFWVDFTEILQWSAEKKSNAYRL